jgi:hypothetical protein
MSSLEMTKSTFNIYFITYLLYVCYINNVIELVKNESNFSANAVCI